MIPLIKSPLIKFKKVTKHLLKYHQHKMKLKMNKVQWLKWKGERLVLFIDIYNDLWEETLSFLYASSLSLSHDILSLLQRSENPQINI